MNIVGLFPVRNEEWSIGLTLRAALMWMDSVVVLDHCSTDRSRDIALEIAEETKRVTVICEDDPVWREMAHRQKLLDVARQLKATHIALVDADEIVTANLLPRIRGMFENLPKHRILQIPWLALRGSLDKVHISGAWADHQNVTTGFVDSPDLGWTSASRGGYDFHHRQPMGRQMPAWLPVPDRNAGLMHLQFVSDRRLRAKQALYKCTERLRWPGREPVVLVDHRYNLAVYGGHSGPLSGPMMAASLGAAPYNLWWDAYQPLMEHFRPDAEPWQEAEVRKLLQEHGRERFAGLDLFGVGG